MTDNFLNFITETTSNNFRSSQNEVFNHPEYNPYSDDIYTIHDCLDKNDFLRAIDTNNINIVLSPITHLLKFYAYEKIGKDKEAQSELFFAQKIMEGISLTGNGTIENPYFVTRISDEKDMLKYFQEEFISQSLIKNNDKIFDLIRCQSGREIYFDITVPYKRKETIMNDNNGELSSSIQKFTLTKKKWWQFWK